MFHHISHFRHFNIMPFILKYQLLWHFCSKCCILKIVNSIQFMLDYLVYHNLHQCLIIQYFQWSIHTSIYLSIHPVVLQQNQAMTSSPFMSNLLYLQQLPFSWKFLLTGQSSGTFSFMCF